MIQKVDSNEKLLGTLQSEDSSRTLTARILSSEELFQDYLALRFSTLHSEMGWAKKIPLTLSDFRDKFDENAWRFGLYLDKRLIAAIRLISADSPAELPSGPFIKDPHIYSGSSAEISKAMVDVSFRNCGLFTALMMQCRIESCNRQIEHLFISVIDSDHARSFLARERFEVLGLPFRFEDHTIAPEAKAIVLHSPADTRASLTDPERLNSIYAAASRALTKRLTV